MSIAYDIRCPECGAAFSSTNVIGGDSVKCPKGHRFNSFAIYRSFVQDLEFAARIVDYMTEAVFRDYTVLGTEADRKAVDQAFERWNFWNLFRDVVKDTIIYGDSFLVQNNHEGFDRIEPADADFTFKIGVRRG